MIWWSLSSPSDDLMITLVTILIIHLWTANNRGVHLPAWLCICSIPLSQGGPFSSHHHSHHLMVHLVQVGTSNPLRQGWPFSSPPFKSSDHILLERKLTAITEMLLKKMSSVFFGYKFWSMLSQYQFRTPAHCEHASDGRKSWEQENALDVEKSWEHESQMHCFKIRCTGVSLTMQVARDRVVQPRFLTQ